MTKDPEVYFQEGCGRCVLGGTPDCKVHSWSAVLALARAIILKSGLYEEAKWGMPVYSYQGKNVLMLAAFKEYVSISFFKGALLKDEYKILVEGGPNSREAMLFKCTSAAELSTHHQALLELIFQSIEVEKAGLKVPKLDASQLKLPEELLRRFEADAEYKAAFYNLTPGKQRGYSIYFSQAKQESTLLDRIDKMKFKVLLGKGYMD